MPSPHRVPLTIYVSSILVRFEGNRVAVCATTHVKKGEEINTSYGNEVSTAKPLHKGHSVRGQTSLQRNTSLHRRTKCVSTITAEPPNYGQVCVSGIVLYREVSFVQRSTNTLKY